MLFQRPTPRPAAAARHASALTLACLGGMSLVLAACTAPEVILSGDRIAVLPDVTVETVCPRRLPKGPAFPRWSI